jgi:hypothetical protein
MCLRFRYGVGRLFCRYHPVVVGLFMVSFVLFTTLTMIKLVVAVVLDNFGDAVDMDLEKEVCVSAFVCTTLQRMSAPPPPQRLPIASPCYFP